MKPYLGNRSGISTSSVGNSYSSSRRCKNNLTTGSLTFREPVLRSPPYNRSPGTLTCLPSSPHIEHRLPLDALPHLQELLGDGSGLKDVAGLAEWVAEHFPHNPGAGNLKHHPLLAQLVLAEQLVSSPLDRILWLEADVNPPSGVWASRGRSPGVHASQKATFADALLVVRGSDVVAEVRRECLYEGRDADILSQADSEPTALPEPLADLVGQPVRSSINLDADIVARFPDEKAPPRLGRTRQGRVQQLCEEGVGAFPRSGLVIGSHRADTSQIISSQ